MQRHKRIYRQIAVYHKVKPHKRHIRRIYFVFASYHQNTTHITRFSRIYRKTNAYLERTASSKWSPVILTTLSDIACAASHHPKTPHCTYCAKKPFNRSRYASRSMINDSPWFAPSTVKMSASLFVWL